MSNKLLKISSFCFVTALMLQACTIIKPGQTGVKRKLGKLSNEMLTKSLTNDILKNNQIEAFKSLSQSSNTKVIITDGKTPLLGIPEGGKWFKTVTNFHQNHLVFGIISWWNTTKSRSPLVFNEGASAFCGIGRKSQSLSGPVFTGFDKIFHIQNVTNFHQNVPKNRWKSFPKNPFSPTTIRFRERIIFWWFSWQFTDFICSNM